MKQVPPLQGEEREITNNGVQTILEQSGLDFNDETTQQLFSQLSYLLLEAEHQGMKKMAEAVKIESIVDLEPLKLGFEWNSREHHGANQAAFALIDQFNKRINQTLTRILEERVKELEEKRRTILNYIESCGEYLEDAVRILDDYVEQEKKESYEEGYRAFAANMLEEIEKGKVDQMDLIEVPND